MRKQLRIASAVIPTSRAMARGEMASGPPSAMSLSATASISAVVRARIRSRRLAGSDSRPRSCPCVGHVLCRSAHRRVDGRSLGAVIGVHHDRALFTWQLGTVAMGYDVAEFGGDRIRGVVGFFA